MKKTVHKIVVHLLLGTVLVATGAEHQQLAKTTAEKNAEYFQALEKKTNFENTLATGISHLQSLDDKTNPSTPRLADEHKHHTGFHWPHHKDKDKKTSPSDSLAQPHQPLQKPSPSDSPGNKKKRLSQQIEHGVVETANILDPVLVVVSEHREVVAAALTPLVGSDQAKEFASDISEGAKGFSELGKEIIEADEEANRPKKPARTLTADVEEAQEKLHLLEKEKKQKELERTQQEQLKQQQRDKRKSAPHPKEKISSGKPRKPSDAQSRDKSLQPIVEETALTKTPPTQSPLPRRTKGHDKPTDNTLIAKIETELHKTKHDKETTTSDPDQHKPIVPAETSEIKKLENAIVEFVDPKDPTKTSDQLPTTVPEVKNPDDDSFIKRHPWLVKGGFTAAIIASIVVALYKFNQLPPNIAQMIDEKLAFITTQLTTLTSRQWFNS